MNTDSLHPHRARFRSLLDYIDRHLEEELSLEQLSGAASSSKYHFHRQFSGLFGLSVHKYVQRCRLKRAAFQLAFREQRSVTEVALSSGYDAPEAFSRAFKKAIGQSPAAFRENPRWDAFRALYQPVRNVRREHMASAHQLSEVRIVDFPETRVAALEHKGDPAGLEASIGRFIAWRKEQRLPPRSHATYNIAYCDLDDTPPEEFRFDVCVATDRAIAANAAGIVAKTLPHGRCAVLRHTGSDDTLDASVRFLYAQWLPQSGEDVRDFPLFMQRVAFFPDVPEHEAIVDIFLPLKG